jgi:FRG domain
MKAYEYLAHLRHNGFPSPLLDWSRSPYVAAYFAFSGAVTTTDAVAIYLYLERPYGRKVGGEGVPAIRTLRQYARTHRRHFRQQSAYTVCANYQQDEFDGSNRWRFVSHQTVFDMHQPTPQDFLWKIVVPSSEHDKVLMLLDDFNLNAYSLFGSEESLMETLAYREIDRRDASLTPT